MADDPVKKDDQQDDGGTPWGQDPGLTDPPPYQDAVIQQTKETLYKVPRTLKMITKLDKAVQKRYSGLRIPYSPKLNQAMVLSLKEYPDLAPPGLSAESVAQQTQDIQSLTEVRDGAQKVVDCSNFTLTMRQGYLAEQAQGGVDYMRQKLEDAAKLGMPDARVMSAYSGVVEIGNQEAQKAQQGKQDRADAMAQGAQTAQQWQAAAMAYKSERDAMSQRLAAVEQQLAALNPPATTAPAPATHGKHPAAPPPPPQGPVTTVGPGLQGDPRKNNR